MSKFKLQKEINIVSRQEQEDLDFEYWSKKSPAERLEAAFFLLQQYLDMHPDVPRRLQRAAKITYRKKSDLS